VIIFNGEVFNFHEIRTELEKCRGEGTLTPKSCWEAIERLGLDAAVQRFVGMFAFALWDRREKKTFPGTVTVWVSSRYITAMLVDISCLHLN